MSWKDRRGVVMRVVTAMGRRDHYAHFILDFMIPVWNWLRQNELLYREDFTVYFRDESVENFRPIINSFFHCNIRPASELDGDGADLERVMVVGMESHNRKIMGLGLDNYFNDAVAWLDELQDYTFKKLGVKPDEELGSLVLVDRPGNNPKRAGGRRNTSNMEEIASAMRLTAARKKLEYKRVALEDIPFREQVLTFANAKAVVAQHGASLVNLLWMRRGSVLVEYHWNDKEAYRKRQFCRWFQRPLHVHVTGPRTETRPTVDGAVRGAVEAPVDGIIGALENRI